MIDRCAGCGWPLQENFACCPGAGYWSKRAPFPRDIELWGEPLVIEDFSFYGNPNNPYLEWSPAFPEPPGYHPGYPPLVLQVYRAYLEKAERTFGARSLLHYQEFLHSIFWAEVEIEKRTTRGGSIRWPLPSQ